METRHAASLQGVTISVEDNGLGMDEETRRNLFRLDRQHSHTGTAGEQGSGLGLIVCKELIEKNGGTMSVESEAGKGSKLTIEL
jgi:signal transduction histidine kinase